MTEEAVHVVFDYDGVQAKLFDENAPRAAMTEMEFQLDEAETKEESRDGHSFCGCMDCFNRVISGYWISWTIKMIRQGKIQI